MTTTTNRRIASTIRDQIDPMILASVGAREFAFDGPSLIFRVGPGGKRKAKITLTADDLYTVELFEQKGSLRAGTFRIETTFSEGTDAYGGLYHDMLDDSLRRMEATWA